MWNDIIDLVKDKKHNKTCGEVTIKKYRKKPVVVEVMKWDGMSLTIATDFCGKRQIDVVGKYPGPLKIITLEGVMQANIGDYIIKGVKGECYPCKPEIFEMTYEAVE